MDSDKLSNMVENYSKEFPNYPKLVSDKGWLYGSWMIGNYYKRKHQYYGEYPPSYLRRIHSLFPESKKVLHLFSGAIEKGLWEEETTVDIIEELSPDILCNAEELSKIITIPRYDLAIADPPYEQNWMKYGTKPINKRIVLHELAKIVKKGGFLVWLDTRVPIYTKREWDFFGTILLYTGTNRIVRIVALFRRI